MKPLHIKISIAIFVVLLFCSLYVFMRPKSAKADSLVLSATDCSGGFDNPELAEGNQNVLSAQISKYNTSNSAILKSGMQAELKCKNFDGEIIDGAIPQKITAKFSWAATYDSKLNEAISEEKTIDSGPAIIPPVENATTSTVPEITNSDGTANVEQENTPTEEVKQDTPSTIEAAPLPEVKVETSDPTPAPTPTPTPIPIQTPIEAVPPATVSFLDSFINIAFAEEMVTSTSQEIIEPVKEKEIVVEPVKIEEAQKNLESSSTENELNNTTSTLPVEGLATTTAEQRTFGVVEILYSLNGTSTESLGFVDADEFDSATFDIPVIENMKWDDVKNISIYIRSVSTTDNVTPIIYVDSVMLDVEYSVMGEEIHPYPTIDRGDVFNGEAAYENYTAFLVSRPISERATTTMEVSVNTTESTSTATSSLSIPTKEEIWISDNNASTTDRWMFVASDKTIDKNTKVFFRYGYLFWIGSNNTLWVFNPKSQSFNSASIEADKPTQYLFNDESGGEKVMIITQPDNVVAFEDYIKNIE